MKSDNSQNYPNYSSVSYDREIDNALLATSDEERSKDYKNAEALLAQDMPIMPIYHYVNARLVNASLGGYPMKNPENNVFSKDLYFVEK